ncbi:sugar ABC transporter ATP-binding protein [Rhizobium sp. BK251]|uniref:sugar ABC transporter ATP-binding protein n=1 Tax=Rhizobium sp. BK251 TaxID=2512125 RepID=UPI001050D496|nr:sugar ABC transporter ATP-binding protein [Rhizobium sp. BK251]TCL71418.1 ribose transport system ATP-binding protein [Rhizobium sp. BK251]
MAELSVSKIAKSYDGNPAVREISFSVSAGKVLALCGENGAGKSTLMKMLSGAVTPDSGEIRLDGNVAEIGSPADAMALGICTVYQELSLLPHLSVGENMLLGRMPCRRLPFMVDWRAANRIAGNVLADFGFPGINPRTLVRDLSVAQQQIVEIAKALVAKPRILILDEPTAVLSAMETERLFAKVRDLAAGGATILYISHRLEEIFEIADEFVVLKDGRSVLAGGLDEVNQGRLIEAMVGRPLEAIFPDRIRSRGEVVLEVEHLTQGGAFDDIGLRVHAGEIVGMFGLVGSGRTEIAKAIFGARPADGGSVRLSGSPARFSTPAQAVRSGIAMITEDRKGDGLALDASVLDNAGLASFGRTSRLGVIDGTKRRRLVEDQTASLSVRPKGTARPVRQLSGGNQQKVVLAKWLLVEGIKLFIFDEPTRGVDIATKVEIYRIIADLAANGAAVLLISSEMPEVIGLSDRLIVMREGHIAAELTPDQFSMETLFMHAAGLAAPETRQERLH